MGDAPRSSDRQDQAERQFLRLLAAIREIVDITLPLQ
jgi:hypothetical protein